MIKTILVPATGAERDAAVFAAALCLARAFDAHVDFLHVRVDAVALAATMTADGGSGMVVGGLIDRIEEDSDRREEKAKAAFDGFCTRAKLGIADSPAGSKALSAAWRREVGAEPDCIVAQGRAADLIVLGRPDEEDGAGSLEAALIDSGRPVFLPPAVPLSGLPEKVAIAWKDVPEAARAVTAAMPFLALAKQILVLAVEEKGAAAEPAERLAKALAWRGRPVAVRRLAPGAEGAGEALLAQAKTEGALLVMGGYGHSRFREWVFGGVTRRVLRGADVPVLIAH
jgi:nucleotide-binding universal stress UspA family protein